MFFIIFLIILFTFIWLIIHLRPDESGFMPTEQKTLMKIASAKDPFLFYIIHTVREQPRYFEINFKNVNGSWRAMASLKIWKNLQEYRREILSSENTDNSQLKLEITIDVTTAFEILDEVIQSKAFQIVKHPAGNWLDINEYAILGFKSPGKGRVPVPYLSPKYEWQMKLLPVLRHVEKFEDEILKVGTGAPLGARSQSLLGV